nr:protein ZINC INDUCED FACILITATOR-LIKE 1 isoform X4 [Oryza sativa Japonica Group]
MANRANVSSLSTDIINQFGCEPRHLIIPPWSQELRNSKQEERKKLRWLQATLRRHCWCWRRRTNTMRAAPPAPWSAARRSTRASPTCASSTSGSSSSSHIRDLHVAKRVEDIGFYAGFVGSLNGLLGPIRAYAVEVCRPEHQSIGLSLVSTSWAIGLIVGPAIGGYLAQETLHKHATERNGDCKIGSLSTHLVDSEEFVKQHTGPAKDKSLFKNWPLMSSIVLFCIVSFDDMAYTEIFSLWSESDKQFGGLNFSSEDVGQVLAITGASILIYQTFIYPHIVKVLGIINTSRVAVILSMAILCSYPPMTYLSRPWLSIVVNIASMLKNNFVVTINTCSFILQNNSVPQHQRATANGLATTLMSFFKAFAPAGAGILFSWAQKRQHAFFFPGDQMVFFILIIIEFLELIWTFKPFLAVP